MTITNGFKEPPFSVWHWLGFRGAFVPAMDDEDGWAPGQITTNVFVYLDWKDRLRALVSGRLEVQTRIQTDVHVSRARSRSKVGVLPPGIGARA